MKSPLQNSCAAAEDLPWLVNGTLEPVRAQQLRQHLERCEHCRSAFEFEQRIATAMREVTLVEYAPHGAFASLAARIGAEERKSAARQSWAETGMNVIRRALAQITTPRALMFAISAQALGIAVLAIMLASQLIGTRAPAQYRTLTQPAAAAPATSGPTVRMLFEDQTTAMQIRNLLSGVNGRIVAGPSTVGVFTVELDASIEPASPDLIDWLRVQPGVRLVEPVLAPTDVR